MDTAVQQAPQVVLDLVERFDLHRETYLAGGLNETQLRNEFLNPFFEALGWDIFNRNGYHEAYKDVVHEDAIKVGGKTEAPDYGFRIGGVRKFFVEAKRPSHRLKDEPLPALQLRRYGWSAKLALSILTDFEEFAVYDCRVKPEPSDPAGKARVHYYTYKDFPRRWGEIAGLFSREAILKGAFDRYAQSAKLKRGTAEVDAAFLAEIEEWRELLARNLALRNRQISESELNHAVQMTLDRIVFLRMCEDRGIEPYGQLQEVVRHADAYAGLLKLFRHADDRYNSGLFHFEKEKDREPPDTVSATLTVDGHVLKTIVKHLYHPDSSYEFSVIPTAILGQVYERFLGKVIRLSPSHRAVVEEKPEVRKAGGVYYTPAHIVEAIVKRTIGRWLEGKTLKQAAMIVSFR